MTISRAHVSTHRGDVIYLEAVRWPVNSFTRSRTMFNLILLLVWEHGKIDNVHILDINVLINWQLSKPMFWSINSCQNRVPADQYHLTVSRAQVSTCLLYTSDAADEEDSVDLGGRRIIKKKECISFCTSNGKRKHNQVTQNSVSFSNQKKFQDVP